MTRAIAIALVLSATVSTASAQDLALRDDLPLLDPVRPTEWYGLPILLADAATAATMMIAWVAGVNPDDRFAPVLDIAMVGYAVVGPAFHFAEGDAVGVASLGLRAGAVAGGALEIWSVGVRGLVLAAVSAIDATLFAWRELPFPLDVSVTAQGATVQSTVRW